MLSVGSLLAAGLALASAVVVDHTGYPRYCAKDMAMAAIQPVADPQAASMTLVHVQMMVRHGARTPFSDGKCWDGYNESWTCNIRDQVTPVLHAQSSGASPTLVFDKTYVAGSNAYPGNCLLGQMVDEGYFQQQRNGANFRKAYVGTGPLSLFQAGAAVDLTNTSDVFFESTDMQRTVNSGMIIAQNFFSDATTSAPIPWHTNDLSSSFVTPNPSICPALNDINAEWLASAEYKAWATNATNVACEKELQTHISGYNHVLLFDCLMTQRCTDRILPNGMDHDLYLRSVSHEEKAQLFQYLYKNSAYARTGMATFIARIRTRLQAAIAGYGPRLILSAVHDTTLMPLLAALGGDTYLTEWVPYASHVGLELYYQVSTKSHFFRLLYQGRPLPISACASELCPVQAFLDMSAFATAPNVCKVPQPFAPLNVTAMPIPQAVLTGTDATESSGYGATTMALIGLGGIVLGAGVGFTASKHCINRAGYSQV
ncbi:hypothetical protein SDRG_10835 [Saprolegnia diclina VS20]|uniref:Acid phosphatase n=1 Tax=Saprolegnia diclina (strain VS20) TaxID=1156394 RepID=T0QDK9_SAPDV|nr:hypothetical protein SDRG_10835 [Saprolegnia diclina VS20]EQC31670.1 hypothetical protein SDRG_10835 [Saprolegnia diclina VS20]|eukprot:XP_008615069.1 hypothetical protein SDRG_10835 [Saprolegnia diclina VS20]